jgi:Fanconi anemia group I protein
MEKPWFLCYPSGCVQNHARQSFLSQLLVLNQAEKVLEEVDWLITKLKGQASQEIPPGKVTSCGDPGIVMRASQPKSKLDYHIKLELSFLWFFLVG